LAQAPEKDVISKDALAGELRYTRVVRMNRAGSLMSGKRVVAVAVAIAVLAMVSGCGRKSGLDTPYEAAVDAREEAEKNKEPLPPVPTKPDPDKPFILDGLIK
jgi:predicted small lipoprotein YifL